jgi:prevent-host-death family protein
MKTLSVSEFKKTCTRVLREIPQSGEPILITSRNRPVAKVIPTDQEGAHPSWGALRGRVGSIADNFDEPLGDEEWDATQ